MPFCPACGAASAADAQFCQSCGEQLPENSGDAPHGDASRQTDAETAASTSDSLFSVPSTEPVSRPPGIVRKALGSVAVLVVLFGLLLTARQLRRWAATGDGYYLVSAGLFLVVLGLLWAGVSWGFAGGARAERIFGGTVGLAALCCILAALYFWVTGRVVGSDVDAVFAALVWSFTGGCLVLVTVGVTKAARTLAASRT